MIRLMNEYNYESPISIATAKMQDEYNERLENECMLVIKEKIGIDVNKDELIKALNYDRAQYEKGFRDGISKAYHHNHGHWIWHNRQEVYECSACGWKLLYNLKEIAFLGYFCPYCGAKMDERTVDE